MSTNVAFVTYETRYAPSGGIAAVMDYLPRAVKAASGLRTVVATPYHWRIEQTVGLDLESVARAQVRFLGANLDVGILRYVDQIGVEWFFLRPDDEALFTKAEERFFAGSPHPYRTPEPVLVRDAILFGACVAQALPSIDPAARWIVMAQDWEGAAAALALSRHGRAAHRVFQTLHNSYDSGGVDPQALRDVGIDPTGCPANGPSEMPSVLERALGCVAHPIFTVSHEFARELTDDVLQADVMAPHLRDSLRTRLVGIDNGPFIELALDPAMMHSARDHDYGPLAYWKQQRRQFFVDAIHNHTPTDSRPVWGDRAAFARLAARGAPWFVLAGRDDPRQRGHDVATLAIDGLLDGGANAQFIFLPIPADEGLRGLEFLHKLARKWPERVLVLPFLFREGYFAALEGAAFGVMPSLYEPFGGANEFYLHGTVGIARATGGLIQQIIPLRAAASYDRAVHERAARWHTFSAQPTGLLYREPDEVATAALWHEVNRGSYHTTGSGLGLDRVEHRSKNPLFVSMARELRLAFEDGIRLWAQSRDLYWQMLVDGVDYIQRTYSWRRTAQEYVRMCDL